MPSGWTVKQLVGLRAAEKPPTIRDLEDLVEDESGDCRAFIGCQHRPRVLRQSPGLFHRQEQQGRLTRHRFHAHPRVADRSQHAVELRLFLQVREHLLLVGRQAIEHDELVRAVRSKDRTIEINRGSRQVRIRHAFVSDAANTSRRMSGLTGPGAGQT